MMIIILHVFECWWDVGFKMFLFVEGSLYLLFQVTRDPDGLCTDGRQETEWMGVGENYTHEILCKCIY